MVNHRTFRFMLLFVVCMLLYGSGNTAPAQESPPYPADGRFRLSEIDGRHVLIAPDGKPFVALGINHLGELNREPNTDWQQVLTMYRSLGCTVVGNGGGGMVGKMPYIVAGPIVRTSKYYNPPGGRNPYDYPDVFDPTVQSGLRERVRAMCVRHRNNPLLVAYCWTDTPCWDLVRTRAFRATDWVSEIRELKHDAPGKIHYVEFLRERFGGDIQALNRAYGLKFDAFSRLRGSDFRGLDRSWPVVLHDDQQFLGVIAREFYKTVGEAQREYDPTHLVFGEKYLAGDYPDQVILAAAPYIDALSVQPGDGYINVYPPSDNFDREEFDRLHQLVNKPIFICDHQISFATPDHPRTTWTQRPSEADAANATMRFMSDAFLQPYVIGYMRCQYLSRWDGRRDALKQGLVAPDGTPYELATAAFRKANFQIVSDLKRRSSVGQSVSK